MIFSESKDHLTVTDYYKGNYLSMKVARASAGRPIRALWVIHLARGIKRPRNPF